MEKEWTEAGIKYVFETIKKWIKTRTFKTLKNGTIGGSMMIRQMENLLGLPYTSSGRHAGLWICNDVVYLDLECKYHIVGFCMDVRGCVYAECFDKDENELFIPINK